MSQILPANESDGNASVRRRLTSIVQCAILAPSSHNTQCWKFIIDVDNVAIAVRPDFDRRCPVVDPDDHHLYATLGCAVENIVVASGAYGLEAKVDTSVLPKEGVRIRFRECEVHKSDLFYAIPKRQCTRNEYDGKSLSEEELDILKKSSEGNGVRAMFLTDEASIENVLGFILRANTAQIEDTEFVDELTEWIQFNEHEASRKGDGLRGACMGSESPSVPKWLGSLVLRHLVLKPKSENAKVMKQVRSSAGLALFVSEKDDPGHWVEAGRAYERFALQATALGIKNAFLNMPAEVEEVRRDLADSLGLGEGTRLDFVVRFGMGREMPRSFRRPLESVVEYVD